MPADLKLLKEDLSRRMDGALETLRREFAGLRTGRAHTGLLEPIKIVAYGQEMPLIQVGTLGSPNLTTANPHTSCHAIRAGKTFDMRR